MTLVFPYNARLVAEVLGKGTVVRSVKKVAKPGFLPVDIAAPTNPDDTVTAYVDETLLSELEEKPQRTQNIRTAIDVLKNPLLVAETFRHEKKSGYCYTGLPKYYYYSRDVRAPIPEGKVFAVFLDTRYHMFEWRLERCDPTDRFLPMISVADIRFGETLWRADQ